MVDWISLAVPFAYLGVLIGSLATFSSLYRKRKAAHSSSLQPWFPPHLQRNIYLSLLHHEQTTPEGKSIPIPDSVLKAALLRRATEDIARIIQIKTSKPALATLLQRGSVGDELWQRFLRAEQEIEEELKDVVAEANALAPASGPSMPSWGQTIFQSANEMHHNALLRRGIEECRARGRAEREWWDRKREEARGELMGEEVGKSGGTKGEGKEKVGSDEDGVLVEKVEGGKAGDGGGGGGGGGKKKKKGKK